VVSVEYWVDGGTNLGKLLTRPRHSAFCDHSRKAFQKEISGVVTEFVVRSVTDSVRF